MKVFYGKRIRDANQLIESEKSDTLAKTKGVIVALDTGIVRLKKLRRDVDDVIARLHEMKDEVDAQRTDIRKTSQSLRDIERSLVTASELKQCKQCYTDLDIERIKFERKQQKIFKVPGRFSEEISLEIAGLKKKVKSIQTDIDSQFAESKVKLEIKARDANKSLRDLGQNPPYMDIKRKYAKVRAPRKKLLMLPSAVGQGQVMRRQLQADGRMVYVPYERQVRLPAISERPGKKHLVQFTNAQAERSSDEQSWHIT